MNPPAPTTSTSSAAPAVQRVAGIDAYRGFVMFLMMAEALSFHRVADAHPESGFWTFLAHHQSHVEWVGCSLHDLIQPSFSFLVGVSLAFSVAKRMASGQGMFRMLGHAAWRSVVLVLLGVFLRSIGHPQTNWTFEDTLTQIGLGYPFLFLLGFCPRKVQWGALIVLLAGYWAAFVAYPVPGPGFDWSQAGVAADWNHHLNGLAAHWNKNTNLAWAADRWFLNLFPRGEPFVNNGGGYSTLSFVPTLATMLLGLIAGGWLRADAPVSGKIRRLLLAGVAALALGWLLGALGICPVVKRIWTPSWVLFSGGWCFLLLAGFYAVLDLMGFRWWAFPLMVIGANPITAYCMDHLFSRFIRDSFRTHLGQNAFAGFGPGYSAMVEGAAVLLVLWLILYWMYRNKIFVRI